MKRRGCLILLPSTMLMQFLVDNSPFTCQYSILPSSTGIAEAATNTKFMKTF